MNAADVLLAPVVSEKSYAGLADRKYTFKVHRTRTRRRCARPSSSSSASRSRSVNIVKVQPEAQAARRHKGVRPGWKKAIVQLREGQTIEIFEGAQV